MGRRGCTRYNAQPGHWGDEEGLLVAPSESLSVTVTLLSLTAETAAGGHYHPAAQRGVFRH